MLKMHFGGVKRTERLEAGKPNSISESSQSLVFLPLHSCNALRPLKSIDSYRSL